MSRSTYLLVTQFERLEEWCRHLRMVFDGQTPYLVGSSNDRADFRDVDVRIILPDAVYDRSWNRTKVRMVNRAMSIWGQQETGLPIDFQVQRQTEAAVFTGPRNPMGTRDWRAIATSGTPVEL